MMGYTYLINLLFFVFVDIVSPGFLNSFMILSYRFFLYQIIIVHKNEVYVKKINGWAT